MATTPSARIVADDDLALFFLIHKAIRQHTAAFARVVPALRAGAVGDRAARLGEWFSFLERAIHTHHGSEDAALYPLLLGKEPALGFALERLERDHAELDPLTARISECFEVLAWAEGEAFERARDAAAEDLARFDALMTDHLDREEDALLRVMKRAMTVDELKVVEDHGSKHTSLRDIGLVVPWVFASADEHQAAVLRSVLPWPMRLLYRWSWKPRFDRIAAAVAA